MTPVLIPHTGKTYQMPNAWNELTPLQLIAIAPVILSTVRPEDATPYIINSLLGWNRDIKKVIRRTKDVSVLFTDIRNKLYPLVDWIFKSNNLTKNILPVINIPAGFKYLSADKLYGPADSFNNLTIGEFDDAEYWFDLYHTGGMQDMHALDMMIAILYRAPMPKYKPEMGDIRQPYNIHLNELRAAQLAKVSVGIKKAILLWYMGCRSEIVESYPFLFKKSDKGGAAGLKGWTPIIYDLAGGKFGTLNETANTPLKTILYELQLSDIKLAEMKAKHPELFKK
jgi:hypothetical protein